MTKRSNVWFLVGVLIVAAGCQVSPGPVSEPPAAAPRTLDVGCTTEGSLPLSRGDWAISARSAVWKVMELPRGEAPTAIGFLVRQRYRQNRGGRTYDLYTVSTLNRNEEIGRIDQVGRAYRFEPRRDAGFEEIDVGLNTLENSVAAIFDTALPVSLEQTTERRLAFESIDRDGSGYLEAAEVMPHGDRLRRADTNADGLIDFAEFDALDQL